MVSLRTRIAFFATIALSATTVFSQVTCDTMGLTSCTNGYGMATIADMQEARSAICEYIKETIEYPENCSGGEYGGTVVYVEYDQPQPEGTYQSCLDALQDIIDTCPEQEGAYWYSGTYQADGLTYTMYPCPLVSC